MRCRQVGRDFRSWKRPRSRLSAFAALLLVLAVLPGISLASTPDQAAQLSRLIAAARQEGVIDFEGPSSLTPRGAAALIAALNKKYGLHLKLHYAPARSFSGIAAQLVTEESAGQPPTYDVVYQTPDTIGALVTRNLLEPVHWRSIFPYIPEKSILLHGRALLTDNQFMLPAYNTKLVSPQEVPKSWNDFLAPKWKGKILVPADIGTVGMFWAQMWGEEKTIEYLKKLREQGPILGRFPEIETRLASGEYPLALLQLSPFVMKGQEAGAPVAFDAEVKPGFVQMDIVGVMKKARHPNAATLFTAFTLTPEGVAIWWKYAKRSSIATKGSWAEKFSRGKRLLFPDADFIIKNSRTFAGKFGKALGVR